MPKQPPKKKAARKKAVKKDDKFTGMSGHYKPLPMMPKGEKMHCIFPDPDNPMETVTYTIPINMLLEYSTGKRDAIPDAVLRFIIGEYVYSFCRTNNIDDYLDFFD